MHRGVYLEDVFHLRNPHAVVDRLARAFVQWGGRLRHAEVRTIGNGLPGLLEVVVAGERIAADQVVIAAGSWSKRLLGRLAERIPLDTERGYHVVFPEAASLLRRPVAPIEGGFFMTPMEGGLRAAGTVEFAGLDAPPPPGANAGPGRRRPAPPPRPRRAGRELARLPADPAGRPARDRPAGVRPPASCARSGTSTSG